MTLEQRLVAFAQAVGIDIGALLSSRGVLANLTTTEKTNLVGAINELKASIATIDLSALIDDAATATDTTWSSTKIVASLSALKDEIVDGAPAAYDTLQEIATYLAANDGILDQLLTAIGNRVRYDAAQALTDEQKQQACANIGVGDPFVDLVTTYETSRDA